MKISQHILLVICIAVLFNSCRSDSPPGISNGPSASGSSRVWITNEGNFQQGNSELGIYNPAKQEYSPQVFLGANGTGPGDVLQSINFYNGLAYLVVNNSGKIALVDTSNFSLVKEISGFSSPRFMLVVGPSKAYVTDLYGDAINILDLSTDSIIGNIPCGSWTEKMLQFQHKVFVSMPQNDKVYVLDAFTDQVLDSIQVAYGSNSIIMDKNEDLWVLCSGSGSENKVGGLFKIDPNTHSIEKQWALDENKLPSHLSINKAGTKLYFIYEDIIRMDILATTIPSNPFYLASNKVFYGMNIDLLRNEIYLADAKDYVQKGAAYRLDSNGVLISSFPTGFNPNGFYFE